MAMTCSQTVAAAAASELDFAGTLLYRQCVGTAAEARLMELMRASGERLWRRWGGCTAALRVAEFGLQRSMPWAARVAAFFLLVNVDEELKGALKDMGAGKAGLFFLGLSTVLVPRAFEDERRSLLDFFEALRDEWRNS